MEVRISNGFKVWLKTTKVQYLKAKKTARRRTEKTHTIISKISLRTVENV
jgi:hypothetical protein